MTSDNHLTANPYLVADLFCGAGGSSTGARRAIEAISGTMELVAVNHWNTAVATHAANHPTARHLVEDVSLVDPEEMVEEGRLDLLMASPECRFYSRARGGKPVHGQGRMNPWAIHNWLTRLEVNCVLIENVPEFVDWGPLLPNGKPDKARKGEHFQAWFLTFLSLGYQAEWRMLNAADYGDATTRVRFFLMARKDGHPITWPEPSHAKGDTGMFPGRLPWRGAREIIDWSSPGRSLLDDPKYIKKPLSEKTRRRIARGLERFGGPLAPLYIRLLDLPQDGVEPNGHSEDPETFTLNRHGENGPDRVHSSVAEPEAEPFHGVYRQNAVERSVDEPLHTMTTENVSYLVQPEMQPFLLGQQSGGAPRPTGEPAPTVAASGAISLLQPSIIRYNGQSYAQDPDDPLSAVTSMNKHGIVKPTLVEYYGNSGAADIEKPLPTVTAKARHGLANPTLIQVNHGNGAQGDRGNNRRAHPVEDPLPSITTSPGLGLAQPVLVQTGQTGGNGAYARSTGQPIPTLTTRNDMTVVTPSAEPCIIPNSGERAGQEPRVHDINGPVPAVAGRGAGNPVLPLLDEPSPEKLANAGVDPRRLVLLDGRPYLLDIRFRMLQNAELARAMGFDDGETAYEFTGNVSEVTKQIGNAVPVNLAAALVKAALGQGERG